jgi:hypothetical protein
VWLEGLGKLKKFIDLVGSRTCDHPACSIVPPPVCYHVALALIITVGRHSATRISAQTPTSHLISPKNVNVPVSFK